MSRDCRTTTIPLLIINCVSNITFPTYDTAHCLNTYTESFFYRHELKIFVEM